MSTGVLLFSFNNQTTNYAGLTERCLQHIKKHLDLPVTVVGDREFSNVNNIIIEPTEGNRRIYLDQSVKWYNLERSNAYKHSPYDTTILIDNDYFVMSPKLLELANTDNDILVHDKVYDITHQNNLFDPRDCLIPMVWATVVIFKKNKRVENIFYLIQQIQKNWLHYKNLYRIKFSSFRNDYAFAIALHQMYGFHKSNYLIPNPMFMMGKDAEVIELSNTKLTYKWKKNYATIENTDVHVFNKEFVQ